MAVKDLPDAETLSREYLDGASVIALEMKYGASAFSIYRRLRTVPAYRAHCEARRQRGAERRQRRSTGQTPSDPD